MRIFIDVETYDRELDEHVEKSVVVIGDKETLKMIEDELNCCLGYVGEVITDDGQDYMTSEIIRLIDVIE